MSDNEVSLQFLANDLLLRNGGRWLDMQREWWGLQAMEMTLNKFPLMGELFYLFGVGCNFMAVCNFKSLWWNWSVTVTENEILMNETYLVAITKYIYDRRGKKVTQQTKDLYLQGLSHNLIFNPLFWLFYKMNLCLFISIYVM